MFDLIMTFFSLWLIIHMVVHFMQKILQSKQALTDKFRPSGLLPSEERPKNSSPKFKILNNPFNIRISTNILNNFFKLLAERIPNFWKQWFCIGAIVGIMVFFFSIGIMIVASWKLFIGVFGLGWKVETENITPNIVKRNFEEDHVQYNINNEDNQVFIPVIPGITLPISHLAYYLLALLICGIIHEAGHAIAAANESLEIKSTGIFLYILYPGAFVEFDINVLRGFKPRRQLRIVCAGVWHNIVLFLLGTLLFNTGALTMFMGYTSWRLVDGYGVSVVSVEKDTALFSYLKPSMLITKLDDFDLSGSSLDSWNDYLLQNEKFELDLIGFCTSKKDAGSLDCCDISTNHPYGNSNDNSTSCFKIIDGNNAHKQKLTCLPTIPVLVNIDVQRCLSDIDCSTESPMCVLPYTPKGYPKPLRIYFKEAPWVQGNNDQEKLVLYIGEFADVWEIVQVSILQPRWSWVPPWFPMSIELTLRYTISFSLALGVLNILPAFKLDGHYALTALLEYMFNVEPDERIFTKDSTKDIRDRLENGVIYFVTGLVGWVVIGTLFFSLIHKL